MDKLRLMRYIEKIDHATERIEDINSWYNTEDVEELDKKTRLAIYKAMQEIIEVSMDIVAMILKDLGKLPKDDYSNIQHLFELTIIDNEIKESLNEANGLRNRLVHEYNKLDNNLALNSIKSLLGSLSKFLEVVKKWIKELPNIK